ncbi:MAG: ribonuclease P protein component [Rubrivivax sp.]
MVGADVPPSIGRLVRLVNKADFERVLATPSCSRTAHFAVHHVAGRPTAPVWRHAPAQAAELSTDGAPSSGVPVDDLPEGHWLGAVIPKRHARRSVTRSLLKRQIRGALGRHAGRLPPGLWLVRLRAPFPVSQFPSAASDALRQAARVELDSLLARARSR